ncbi:MAG: phosphatidate cytidylyltransferase [Planctomycetes bacterium]|nr:phosphatidate cytidylyltransferase [Planctomycetota bacterium]
MLGRIVRGLTILAIVLGAHHLDASRPGEPAWALLSLGVLVALAALAELLAMGGASAPRRNVGLLAGVAWMALVVAAGLRPTWVPVEVGDLLAAASLAAGAYLALQLRHGPQASTGRLTESLWFGVPYVAGLGGFCALLAAGNIELVLAAVLVSKASDVGAYFTGKSVGRHKLSPRVSPGKTIEGAVGGVLLSAAAGAWLLSGVLLRADAGGADVHLSGGPWGGALAGAVLGALAVLSDLAESLLKRSRGVKDSGKTFGESGGFLDLVDSLLLVGPVTLAYTALLGGYHAP